MMEASDEIKWGSGKMSTQSMKTIVQQLIDLHVRLSQLAAEKTEAIKIGDVQTLARLTKKETLFVDKVSQLERTRIEEMAQITEVDPTKQWTFRMWIEEVIPSGERQEWDRLYSQLKSAVSNLKKSNQLNQLMLNQALQFVRLNLNLLQPRPISTIYGNHGSATTNSFSGRIDSRA